MSWYNNQAFYAQSVKWYQNTFTNKIINNYLKNHEYSKIIKKL